MVGPLVVVQFIDPPRMAFRRCIHPETRAATAVAITAAAALARITIRPPPMDLGHYAFLLQKLKMYPGCFFDFVR
jgi:hypothetical protein